MFLNIVDKIRIGNNISVSVSGTHDRLKNGVIIRDENNNEFVVLSVAMVENNGKLSDETTMLVKGINEIGTKVYI